jgi:hypothetical protein
MTRRAMTGTSATRGPVMIPPSAGPGARIAPGYPHGLNVHVVEVILILAGMPGPLLAMARAGPGSVRGGLPGRFSRPVAAGSCGRLAERPGTAARGPPGQDSDRHLRYCFY